MSLRFWISLWTRMDSLRPSNIFVFFTATWWSSQRTGNLVFQSIREQQLQQNSLICPYPEQGRSWKVLLLSWICVLVAQSCLTVTLWTVAHLAPLSMGFSMQEYWSGFPFLSPGDLPDPGIEPWSPKLQAVSLWSEPPGKPNIRLG